jgi:replicative DNA helicase
MERLPPQNLEAEMAALGSMILEPEAAEDVFAILNAEDFYKESHSKIFEALKILFDRNQPVDLLTLTEQLKKTGQIDVLGGPAYIAEIAGGVPTAANCLYYANIVKEKATLRKLIHCCSEITASTYEQSVSAEELLDAAESKVYSIATERYDHRETSISEVLHDTVAMIDSISQGNKEKGVVPTGFIDLDKVTRGLHPSELILLAARPSIGKTSFMCCVAENASLNNTPVAIFSLEMAKMELVFRMLCSHARVNSHTIRRGIVSAENWTRLQLAAGRLNEAKIFIDETSVLSPIQLRASARRLKRKHNIGLIAVDYLQLMTHGGKRFDNRQQEVSEISRALKAMAKELNIPVLALCQLSREPEKRERKNSKPRLSDLRESGSLEQDADVVLMLWKEQDDDEPSSTYDKPKQNIIKLEIAKQRNGPTDSVELLFLKEYTRFENLAKKQEG